MGDADVFGKLSRIFETHGFSNDDAALSEMLEDFDPALAEAASSYPHPLSPSSRKLVLVK